MTKSNKEKKDPNLYVKGNDPVTIEWLEDSKYHKKGSKSVVHKIQAKKFVASNKAKIVKEG